MALLIIVAITNGASAFLLYLLYRSAMAGNPAPLDLRSGWLDWANNLAMVGAIVAFSMWTHRAYRNLPAPARHLKFTPAWAVGWLFVPLANLVVPYFVFSEIWNHSKPAPANSDSRGRDKSLRYLSVGGSSMCFPSSSSPWEWRCWLR